MSKQNFPLGTGLAPFQPGRGGWGGLQCRGGERREEGGGPWWESFGSAAAPWDEVGLLQSWALSSSKQEVMGGRPRLPFPHPLLLCGWTTPSKSWSLKWSQSSSSPDKWWTGQQELLGGDAPQVPRPACLCVLECTTYHCGSLWLVIN